MSFRHLVSFPCVALALVFAGSAGAESVEPQKGQSSEQMQKDIGECQATAKQSSGYDPAAATADAPDERQAGGRVKGAAKGAAAGAAAAGVRGRQYDAYEDVSDDAKQEYRQENAKDAAAAGAAVGASRQRQDRRQDRRADKEKEKSANDYHQSYQGCLSSRGYKVTP